ncbi:hypothetical protein ARMSODRAFT_979994 [Armillaria solidipes]|uniref:Uncharacterized protein n=1 Tax=Armillaria solidipes TaxID=1076256 RepID=A0A2H3B0T2_9AGAR|nr:hypothetical protein ARMSODRAFT_979994 [Armillaria solidipes]
MGFSFSSNKTIIHSKCLKCARLLEEASISACSILSCIKNGEWTAMEVLEVYITHAVAAQVAMNCLMESILYTKLDTEGPCSNSCKADEPDLDGATNREDEEDDG